jgi:hypothetical protein
MVFKANPYSLSDDEMVRINSARDVFLRFRSANETPVWIPAWSSAALEHVLDELLAPAGSQIADVFWGLWAALGQSSAPLSAPMANFLLDVVKYCFGRYRARYESEDFHWLALSMQQGCTEAQAYLAAFALPPALIQSCREAIMNALKSSEFCEKVRPMLDSDAQQ